MATVSRVGHFVPLYNFARTQEEFGTNERIDAELLGVGASRNAAHGPANDEARLGHRVLTRLHTRPVSEGDV